MLGRDLRYGGRRGAGLDRLRQATEHGDEQEHRREQKERERADDDNGNQIQRGTDTFMFDHENRLIEAVTRGLTSTSEYNGDGLRMSLTVDDGTPVTTEYAWDVNRSLPVVLDDGTNQYVYGLDLISATDGAGAQTYFTFDGLGSTTDLTNGLGVVTGSYTYDVFGATLTGPATNYWQFTGEQVDADTGLQYLRARYYDPATGRFLGQDPLSGSQGSPQSQNPYAYALNNPATLTDPTGMYSVMDLLNDLRPAYTCGLEATLSNFSCIGDYLSAIGRYNDLVLHVLEQCAAWGIGGAIATGTFAGAAVGCAAGGGLAILDEIYKNPVSACAAWGAAGYKTGGYAGAAVLCATGVVAYYAPDTEEAQCAAWLLGGFANNKISGGGPVRGGLGNCLSAVLSAHEPGVASGNAAVPGRAIGSTGKE